MYICSIYMYICTYISVLTNKEFDKVLCSNEAIDIITLIHYPVFI